VAVLSDILSRVRLELGDLQKNFNYSATGDGLTTRFDTGIKPIETNNLYVTINTNPIGYPYGYTVEEDTGIITFANAPANGSAIAVSGLQDRYFLDAELSNFINDAVNQHTYNRVDAYGTLVTLASIPPVEEYPLAILATIEALWALATDSAFDIDITAPDGVHIPRAQRYSQLSGMIQQRWEQYKTLCAQLNVGLWKIEMGTLIRTSRTTNRYVPVYIGQEIDDSRVPERVYIQNNLTGRAPLPSTVQNYDLLITQGDSFCVEFDFPFDATLYNWASQIRTYPNSPSLYATFTINILSHSSTLSRVQLTLDVSDTEYLPVRGFWDLLATSTTNSEVATTYVRGQVFVTQSITDSSGALDGSW
jgi:hypothetical protein